MWVYYDRYELSCRSSWAGCLDASSAAAAHTAASAASASATTRSARTEASAAQNVGNYIKYRDDDLHKRVSKTCELNLK